MKLKTHADINNLTPALWFALGAADATRRNLGYSPLVVTSGNDSKHRTDSYHYSNQAVDLRTHDLTPIGRELWTEELRSHLVRLGYVVLDEGDHIHIHHPDPDPHRTLERTI